MRRVLLALALAALVAWAPGAYAGPGKKAPKSVLDFIASGNNFEVMNTLLARYVARAALEDSSGGKAGNM